LEKNLLEKLLGKDKVIGKKAYGFDGLHDENSLGEINGE